MGRFLEFVDVALQMGTSGATFGGRQVPVFVPEGSDQDELLDRALALLVEYGFQALDCREKSFEQCIASFPLKWPVLLGKWPSDERKVTLSVTESRLVIVCGHESHELFWKNLCDHSLLYTGGGLPPLNPAKRCVVIPDSACVAAMIKAEDFYRSFPLNYFGPVGTFDSIALSDSPYGLWLPKLLNDGLVERPGKPLAINATVVTEMCRVDPKSAQVAMQLLAQQLEENLKGRPVAEAEDFAAVQRLVLGTLFHSYCVARHFEAAIPLGSVPQELRWVLERYPLIAECAQFVSEYNARRP